MRCADHLNVCTHNVCTHLDTCIAVDACTTGCVQPSECLEITAQTRTSLEMKAQPCLLNVDLFFFDSGRVTKLPDH